jgi:hypothetical protein
MTMEMTLVAKEHFEEMEEEIQDLKDDLEETGKANRDLTRDRDYWKTCYQGERAAAQVTRNQLERENRILQKRLELKATELADFQAQTVLEIENLTINLVENQSTGDVVLGDQS